MAKLLQGAPVAAALTEKLQLRTALLKDQGITPTLAIVRVGERADDLSYERGILKRAEKIGLGVCQFILPLDCSQEELLKVIGEVNTRDDIHGCLMFRPLPAHLDETCACELLDISKDIDCITMGSLAGVFASRPEGFPPCTAEAVVRLLEYYGYELRGADICVVGRSLVIGKPVSMMLQAKNATITMCHTKTRNLAEHCRAADILVVAAGHAKTIGAAFVHENQIVVDVGINWDTNAAKLVGDVDFEAVESLVAAITPVPGGVGSVTTAVLAQHVVEAAERTVA